MIMAAQVTGTQPAQVLPPVAGSAALQHGRSSSAASSQRLGSGPRHTHPTDEDALGAADAATLAGAGIGISISSRSRSSGRDSGSFNGSDAQHSSRIDQCSSRDSSSSGGGGGSRAAAETAAAMLSSLGTAVFEGPLEVFQHRAQVRQPTLHTTALGMKLVARLLARLWRRVNLLSDMPSYRARTPL